MTHDETLAFIVSKEADLNKKAEGYTKQATDIKLQIRVVRH